MTRALARLAELAGAVLIAPILLLLSLVALLITDLLWLLAGKRLPVQVRMPQARAASIVIPNWNGRDLLEKYLPSVIAALEGIPENEIIVVDNGSEDGSADFVRDRFPEVRVLALPTNLGFGGGSNAGFRAAKNDVVVLLNSDMRVEPGFLAPLLAGFSETDVFAVSCQIFLSDPAKRREETGLTEGWWEQGKLRVSHREDDKVRGLFPCFYAGGGSSAFDRAKFLELGGFDDLLTPFYLEDTDLGFQAWKRGWKVLYQPDSVVFHEHRGTIGKKFSARYIQRVLRKNYLLFCWKNVHETPRLLSHFAAAWGAAVLSASGGEQPGRTDLPGIWRAFRQTPGAARARWKARGLQMLSDAEAFARSRGGHYQDLFGARPADGEPLRILFVSPYPILPPVHGGAVFMHETLRALSALCEVHALVLLDHAGQSAANEDLGRICASVETMVRPRNAGPSTTKPHAVGEFASRDVAWRINRIIRAKQIEVVQMEYTPMGQYIEPYHRIVTALFEHDVYFQSVARAMQFITSPGRKVRAAYEYLRALRYELKLLPRCDRIQVCTKENRDYLLGFAPELAARVQYGQRACIDVQAYAFPGGPREPDSILFIGSARHAPNRIAIEWFIERSLRHVIAARPQVRLYLVGFDPAGFPTYAAVPQIQMLGSVEDVKPILQTCAVFVCPIRSGSGVRVKLLEAFAAGIPVVSTRVGAEGLANKDGEYCALADDPLEFALKTLALLGSPEAAIQMAQRARAEVERHWDAAGATARLEESYRQAVGEKARALTFPPGEQAERNPS